MDINLEYKKTQVNKVNQGTYFKLRPTETAPVWVRGEYDKAVSSFGDSKTNSAALAQILAKDYNKAKTTLSSVERPDAYTDYLMAVLGARTDNESMVTESLKSAISKNASLAKKAANDLEFAKYFSNSTFTSIVK